MTRFILLLVVVNVLFVGATSAQTGTFSATVTPISTSQFEQISQLNFGNIVNQAGSVCRIDESGNLTGTCVSDSNTASVGQIQVSGLSANQTMNIVIQGSSDGVLSLTPSATVQGTVSPVSPLSSGEQRAFVTDSDGQNITLTVFGELSLLTNVPAGESRNIEYSVTINIE